MNAINGKSVKKIEASSFRLDTSTGSRKRMADWRVTVHFEDGSFWNDGGHGSKKAAIAYAERYAR